ncbi:MAG: hypothetical protein NVS3B3_23210 [Aquirhabdus sp.]
MELIERVSILEKDVTAIKMDVAVMRSNYVTKADLSSEISAIRTDLHKEINAQTWKLVTFVCGFGGALVASVYFIAKH